VELKDIRRVRETVRQLQRNLSWQSKSDAACCGITLAQCHALLEIGKNSEISLVDLASILGLDNSTISRTIDGMVEASLVKRRSNPEDRRYLKISLTRKGKNLFDSINCTFDQYYSYIFANIPPEKQQQVIENLGLLAEALAESNNSEYCREEMKL